MASNTRGFRLDSDNRLNNFAIEPQVYVDETVQAGWTEYAEKMNGRFAMIGFVALLGMEVLTGHGVIGWLTSL
ncbi:MAG: chlorophyll a/b-binding protein [Snowella sp.]